MRDTAKLKLITEALTSVSWHAQLKLVSWFTGSMNELLLWAGTCACHTKFDRKEEREKCNMKGRLLTFAYTHAKEHMRDSLDEVNGWTPGDALGDTTLMRQMQACMRYAWLLSEDKLEFLNQVPWLLARLNQPGVRDLCLAQWAEAADPSAHHAVTKEFLTPGCALHCDIVAMNCDGTGMSERLTSAWRTLAFVPIDDTPGEGPHAKMKHVQIRARRASWGWQAATDRLEQNLNDIKTLLPVVTPRTDLQWLWDRTHAVVQTKRGREWSQMKVKRRKLEQSVYTMEKFRGMEFADLPGEDSNADSDSDGGDDPARDRVPAGDAGPVPGGANLQMLVDYYQASFASAVGCYFSINHDEEQRPDRHKAFQLLSFRQASSLVRTYRGRKKWRCKVGILALETWACRVGPVLQLDVFEMEDPKNIEFSDLVASVAGRHQVWRWAETPCDVEGCIALTSPELVEPRVPLNTKSVPVLCLIDALVAAGYTFVDRLLEHKPGGLRMLDGRKVHGKRHYLQCILAQEELWSRGVKSFPSNRAGKFYWLLLHGKKVDDLDKAAQKRTVTELKSEVDISCLRKTSTLQRHDAGFDDIAGDERTEEEGEAPAVEGAAPAVEVADDGIAGDMLTEEEGEAPAAEIAGDDRAVAEEYVPPKHISGCACKLEYHRPSGSSGMRIKCGRHPACRKFKSLRTNEFGMGEREAEYWLGAWLLLPCGGAFEHGKCQPKKWQVEAFRDSLL